MHTQFGMKIYLTLQESRGEGDKWGGEMMEGRANGRREQLGVNTLGEG